jgi:hypothetical protein
MKIHTQIASLKKSDNKNNPEPYKPIFEVPVANDPNWNKGWNGNAWKSYRRYVINKFIHNPLIQPVNNSLKKINSNWGLKEKPLIIPDPLHAPSWNELTYQQYNKADVFRKLFPTASAELSHIYKFPEPERKPKQPENNYPVY